MKHLKYRTVKFLIEGGEIKRICEIFNVIPKTVVLKDFKVNFGRFNAPLADPSDFRIRELLALADLFNVDARWLVDMAYNQSVNKKGRPRKKPNQTECEDLVNRNKKQLSVQK